MSQAKTFVIVRLRKAQVIASRLTPNNNRTRAFLSGALGRGGLSTDAYASLPMSQEELSLMEKARTALSESEMNALITGLLGKGFEIALTEIR